MKNLHYKYRKEIDCYRPLAILPVVFYHASINLFSDGYEEVLYISNFGKWKIIFLLKINESF